MRKMHWGSTCPSMLWKTVVCQITEGIFRWNWRENWRSTWKLTTFIMTLGFIMFLGDTNAVVVGSSKSLYHNHLTKAKCRQRSGPDGGTRYFLTVRISFLKWKFFFCHLLHTYGDYSNRRPAVSSNKTTILGFSIQFI